MMDCLIARRTILSNPRCRDNELLEHVGQCTQCTDLRGEIRRLENALERAIKLPTPECLPARIRLRQSNMSGFFGRWGKAASLAACGVIAVVIGLSIATQRADPLWQAAAHHHLNHTDITSGAATVVSNHTLNGVLAHVGIVANSTIGDISGAEPCVIQSLTSAHLIVAGDTGPISVLLMPHSDVDHRVTFETAHVAGLIAPCVWGSIAILGNAGEHFDQIRRQVEEAITTI